MKQKITGLWQKSNVWTAVLCIAALALVAAPLVYISRYVWPCNDDLLLSVWTKEAWLETGNVFYVLKRAWDFVVYKYMGWQGAYSSILLMALQPDIWGLGFYRAGTVFIFVSLFVGIYWLSYVLMVKHGKAPKSVWLAITSLVTFAWFLRVMYTEEAFYWWTGASYYTGFYSWAMMILAAMCTFYTDWEKYGPKRKCFFYIIGILACAFVGGGNYPTCLMFILIGIGLAVAAYIYKKPAFGIITTYTATVLAGLLVSALAPGNQTHMTNDFDVDISVFEAIFISIRDGLEYIASWTNISVVMLYVFLIPFIWQLARSCGWKFKWPVVVTILSGGLYLAEYAPVSYTFGGYAPGRMINLYYINFYWLILFNAFYWIGWIDRVVRTRKAEQIEKLAKSRHRWQPIYVCVAGVLFLLSTVHVGVTNTNLYWVYLELHHGYYQQVDAFMHERVEYFEQHQGEEVAIEAVPYQSVITYFSDVYPEKDNMFNEGMAEYYGLKSVELKKE